LISGIGTDLVDVDRVRKFISKGARHLEGIFSFREIDYCSSKRYPEQHYAARFAAKEAFLKALGTGWRGGIRFCEIEVVLDSLGKPGIVLNGTAADIMKKQVASTHLIHVSLSHLKHYATATVIIETGE
jgi:holo-[acyl-carrier protein] synthase